MIETLAIPLVLLILIALTIWFLALTKGHYIVKVILTPLVLLSSVGVWYSMNSLLGWATSDSLPAKYQLHWVIIEEPNDNEGAIYLLVNSISRRHKDIRVGTYIANTKEPRLYKIPYTREGHKQAQQLKEKLQEGQSLLMSKNKGKGKGLGDGNENGDNDIGGEGGNQEAPFGYLMPPLRLPEK